jgi:hypothetical protein
MLRRLLLLLFLAVSASAQVPLGATKQEVVNLIGWPASTSRGGDRELLNYPDFTVVLEKNRMVNLQFKSGKHKPLSSYLVSPQKTAPASSNQSNRGPPVISNSASQKSPLVSNHAAPRSVPLSEQTISKSVKPRPDVTYGIKRFLLPLALILGCVLGLKHFVEVALSKKHRREVEDLFPRPSRKTQGGLPPLLIPRRKPSETIKPDPIKDGWSMALLKEMEWHRFEQVVAAYERALGNDAELTDFGPDGGVDVRVFEKDSRNLKRVIQCKAFGAQQVGVDMVRSLFGVMALDKCPQGSFYTTSSFTEPALAIGAAEPTIELVDGATFLNRIQRLTLSAQLQLFDVATEGDYKIPTCPSCGIKMVVRTAKKGRSEGEDFYGCRNYPRCQQTFQVKRLV